MSKPPPETEKLGYFVGQWTTEGTILPGPWGGGGTFRWTETTEWMTGKFFVIGRWDFEMPAELGGGGEEIFVMGYDPRAKIYTFDAFSSHGLHQISKGAIEGDSWIWTSEGMQDGNAVQQKMTMQMLAPSSYRLRFEISNDNAIWIPFMEGKATKR